MKCNDFSALIVSCSKLSGNKAADWDDNSYKCLHWQSQRKQLESSNRILDVGWRRAITQIYGALICAPEKNISLPTWSTLKTVFSYTNWPFYDETDPLHVLALSSADSNMHLGSHYNLVAEPPWLSRMYKTDMNQRTVHIYNWLSSRNLSPC